MLINKEREECNMRKSYDDYWKGDISPINRTQEEEVARLKADFVKTIEIMKFKKGERIAIDPYFRHIKSGEGDLPAREKEVLFKWGPWEFQHIQNWVRAYLNMIGFEEVYHFMLRSPIGAIEFVKI